MKHVFADTFYWYALVNPRDQWHGRALSAKAFVGNRPLVTTEEVLIEFLGAMSDDTFHRAAAKIMVDALFADPDITVLSQTHQSFMEGFALYNRRTDKRYSLTDCISMNAMREQGITDVLTNDHHFTQEGFVILVTL